MPTSCLFIYLFMPRIPCGSAGKESSCNAGGLGSISELGRSPGEGKDCPLQYSDLENSTGCIVHGVAKSRTRLSDFYFPGRVAGIYYLRFITTLELAWTCFEGPSRRATSCFTVVHRCSSHPFDGLLAARPQVLPENLLKQSAVGTIQ